MVVPQNATYGIWERPMRATTPCHNFQKSAFQRQDFRRRQCLYREPFKSNRASNMTVLKKSQQKFNVFGILANTPWGLLPHAIYFRQIFYAQHMPCRQYASTLNHLALTLTIFKNIFLSSPYLAVCGNISATPQTIYFLKALLMANFAADNMPLRSTVKKLQKL